MMERKIPKNENENSAAIRVCERARAFVFA